ncbi:MAG: response regulator [Myxococcota bacterium]|nr:response regulator [Myxococcota bacterium]
MTSVLLIDDDDALRLMLAKALEMRGYTVHQASDGEEGVLFFNRFEPDVVITDLIMPNQEGLETIGLISKSDPDARIIAMSGDAHLPNGRVLSTLSSLEIAGEIGARFILQKPFELSDLLEAVQTLAQETR